MQDISYIRNLLTTDAAHTLVRSRVISRLDYCNSLLVGLTERVLDKLQRVQMSAARVVSSFQKKPYHTSP